MFRSTVEVNFEGALRVARECQPYMTRDSAVVNVSSGDGELVYLCSEARKVLLESESVDDVHRFIAWAESCVSRSPEMELAYGDTPAYSISKAALNRAVYLSSLEHGERGPVWLSVCPGDVRSQMLSPGVDEEEVLEPEEASIHVADMGMNPHLYAAGFFYRQGERLDY